MYSDCIYYTQALGAMIDSTGELPESIWANTWNACI